MSKQEPNTSDVLDTAANQGDQNTENEIVNKDAVANTESATEQVPVTDDSVTAPSDEAGQGEVTNDADASVNEEVKQSEGEEGDAETTKENEETKEDKSAKPVEVIEPKKAETVKKAEVEAPAVVEETAVEAEVEHEVRYPITIKPTAPLPIFYRPSVTSARRTFWGTFEIIGPRKDGFFPVYYNVADLGKRVGYVQMTDEEVRKCQSWR